MGCEILVLRTLYTIFRAFDRISGKKLARSPSGAEFNRCMRLRDMQKMRVHPACAWEEGYPRMIWYRAGPRGGDDPRASAAPRRRPALVLSEFELFNHRKK